MNFDSQNFFYEKHDRSEYTKIAVIIWIIITTIFKPGNEKLFYNDINIIILTSTKFANFLKKYFYKSGNILSECNFKTIKKND